MDENIMNEEMVKGTDIALDAAESNLFEKNELAVSDNKTDIKQGKEMREQERIKLKKKYGKVYSIVTELAQDDEEKQEVEYFFQKPKNSSYNRYIKTVSKDITKASAVFLVENIIPEQENILIANLEEYPALALAISQKLLTLLGFSDNINLTKL